MTRWFLATAVTFTFPVIADEGQTSPPNPLREKYVTAQKLMRANSKESCEIFAELAKDNQFPLSDLAFIRARQTCGPESDKTNDYEYKSYQNKPWLWPLALEVALAEKENSKDYISLSEIYFEKSKLAQLVNEKVDLTEKSIFLLKKQRNRPKTSSP